MTASSPSSSSSLRARPRSNSNSRGGSAMTTTTMDNTTSNHSHSSDAATTASSAASPPPPTLRVYWQRWYVLAVFSLLSVNQNLFWLTFSPITQQTQDYFGITLDAVNLLLNWGPIIYVPTIVFTFYLSTRPNSLRNIALACSLMCCFAMCLRCLPVWFGPRSTAALACLHIAHIINAAAGPMVMAPVSQLSCVWFPVHERTTSTSIAVFSNSLGSALGFITISNMVSTASDIPRLLYTHAGLSIFAALLVLVYFPSAPPTSPSLTASHGATAKVRVAATGAASASVSATASVSAASASTASMRANPSDFGAFHDEEQGGGVDEDAQMPATLRDTFVLVYRHFKSCICNPSMLCLSLSCGLLFGVFTGWSALFDAIFQNQFTSVENGWFGFVVTMGAIVGGILLGTIADHPKFTRRFKELIVGSNFLCLLVNIAFALTVTTPFWSAPLLPLDVYGMGSILAAVGFAAGMSSGVYYELAAEITYPVPEAYSAGLITCWINLASVVFIFLNSSISASAINLAMIISIVVAQLLMLPVKATYLRKDRDVMSKLREGGSGSESFTGGGGLLVGSLQAHNQLPPIHVLVSDKTPLLGER